MRRLLVLLLALAACAPRPPPSVPVAETPPLEYPAATRARLLRILEGEWREWGARIVDGRTHAPLDRDEGPVAEQAPAAFSKVLAYWSAVDWQDYITRNKRAFARGAERCDAPERAAGGRDAVWGCQPWSAAFIAFALRSAGIDRAEFPPAAAHWVYVDALIAAGDRWGGRATFLAHDVAEYAPVAGDMICFARGARPLASLAQRRAEAGTPRPMHCDIVSETAPGEVLALGGNVAQAVTAVRYATGPDGRLRRNVRPWFVVFENRIGLAP